MDETDTIERNPENLSSIIEGMLFACGEDGLSVLQLQSVFTGVERARIEQTLQQLKEQCSQRGIELVCFAGRWKYVAREESYPYTKLLYQNFKSSPLSSAALETLALIAYRQPVTRAEIENIRGVGCDAMIKKLQARGLIETAGTLDAVGHPLLYQVTGLFLDAFGLESLQDLPPFDAPGVQEELFEQRGKA